MTTWAPADCVGRTRLLILQSTPFCNIDCEYCYLPGRDDRHRMPFGIVESAVRFVFDHNLAAPDFTVVWHSGEPLVLPIDWYTQAFAAVFRATPASVNVPHAVQTNGMLINEEWCGFFLENAVRVGVSLDGPAWLHDARRRTRSGKGTHDRVMRGIDTLRRNGVPFHVICVIGAQSLDAVDELMDFFIEQGIRDIGFNIEEIEGVHLNSTLQQRDIDARFRSFFARLLDRARDAIPPLAIREQEELLATLRHPSFGHLTRNSQNEPFGFISVSSRGGLYTFSPELAGLTDQHYGEMSVGQLPGADLRTILEGPAFRRIWGDIDAGTTMCQHSCVYFDLCLGGAPVNKLAELGTFAGSETLHCRLSHKAIVDTVLLKLEAELSAAQAMGSNLSARQPF